ncbi:hypothetical protein G6F31_015851 [Rhizopus arrhizus]|nr:hypothetical protein G6F31_015851 [Rhizopus arrhizus]
MPAAEEAAVGRQRRRMRRLQHAMAAGVDDLALLLRIGAPEHEHQAFAFAVEHVHHVVGEALPAPPLVRAGLALFHGQHRIEQQHAALRPRDQAAVMFSSDGGTGTPGGTEKLRPWARPRP